MSGSVSTRTTKYAADFVTDSGQLRLPSPCGAVPAKSISTESPSMRHRAAHRLVRAAVRRRRPRARRRRGSVPSGIAAIALVCGVRRSRAPPSIASASSVSPWRSASSARRRAASLLAASWARRSAWRWPGPRMRADHVAEQRGRPSPSPARAGSAGSPRPPGRGASSGPACCPEPCRPRRRGGRGPRRSRPAGRRGRGARRR